MCRISHDFSHGNVDGCYDVSQMVWPAKAQVEEINAGKNLDGLIARQLKYLLERLETINRPPAGGLSPVHGPSIGSFANIHSDLPRNRYIGRMDNVTVNP